jgi:hypothetical protein
MEEVISIVLEFQVTGDNPAARYEIAERVRELLTEDIEDRLIRADGVEITDFEVLPDE